MSAPIHLREALCARVQQRLPRTGGLVDLRPGLALFQMNGPIPPMDGVMKPTICFVLQGTKRAEFNGQMHTYEEGSFMLSTLVVPLRGEVVVASRERPVVGISFTLDLQEVARLIAEVGPGAAVDTGTEPSAISVHDIDAGVLRVLEGLCDATTNDLEWRILADGLRRELLFRVLRHPGAGWQLRQRLKDEASLEQVARAVAYIEAHLTEPLDVDQISRKAGLSPSRLHAKFRAVTSRSPMQFVKHLRLDRARSLLLAGRQVTDAAYTVGYASPSQFSREFRRQYGHPPSAVHRLGTAPAQPKRR